MKSENSASAKANNERKENENNYQRKYQYAQLSMDCVWTLRSLVVPVVALDLVGAKPKEEMKYLNVNERRRSEMKYESALMK